MSTPENLPQVFEDDSIDLIALLKQIYQGRRFIILSVFITAIFGVIVALATPNTYTAETTFIPQTGGDSKPSSSLSGLASLAGINLGSMGGGSDIPPAIYPQIVSSVPFKLDLLDKPLIVADREISLRDYLQEDSLSFLGKIKKYTIGLPSMLLSLVNKTEEISPAVKREHIKLYQITEYDYELFEKLNTKLVLLLNEEQGFITLKFTDKNKFIASQMAQYSAELLQSRIISFKNQSAKELLDFTTKQYYDNKTLYEALQDSIAIFKDKNLNISSSLYQNRLDRLNRELNIYSSVVEQLASQVEQAKLQVNKDTPVFTFLEPVTVPFERSAPKRSLIVFVSIFLGVTLSIGFVLMKHSAMKTIDSILK